MTKSRRRLVLGAVLAFSLLLLAAGLWVGWRYIETKSMACECGDPVDKDRFALFNPFRDRRPERIAIAVVKTYQSGKCQLVSPGITYCPEGMRADVASWKMTGRVSMKGGVMIRFWVTRPERGGPNAGDPLWVVLLKNGESWKVDRIDTYY